ncbi:MAG TPA: alpha/beta family hydrolase [Acidimicrobiales bacterium]|nr:alpha/beta family hydrolase [Acidimicrobiales bacterium]
MARSSRRSGSPTPAPAGLLLAPGAGAGSDQPSLIAIDDAVTAAGVRVARMDFGYRLAGRRAPDRPPVLLAAVVDAATQLAESAGVPPDRLALGGRSMGGRICSMAVADGLPAAALVLVSYPLHPPGRPDRLRTDHFGALRLPCLFVSGTRDAFGSPAELEAATAAIGGPVTHVWIDGGDHGLRRRDDEVAEAVRRWLCP